MKTHKVRPVLVESKEPNNIYTIDGKLYQTTPNTNIVVSKTDKLIPQQLILISLEDERIEVGENYYNIRLNKVFQAIAYDGYPSKEDCKVIATQTQLSPEYIQKFIEEYNKGEVKDFEIEMIEKIHNHYSGANAQWKELLPKLTNGFVTIVEKLQMPKISADDLPLTNGYYTEEDMLQAFIAGEQYCLMQETSTPKNALPFDKWMHNYKKK